MQQRGLKTSSSTGSFLTARLIVEALLTFVPPTLLALRNATFSRGSPAGLSHCVSPDGLTTVRSGQARVRVSRSPLQAPGGGLADERHLWPVFFDLIRQRRPSVVVGEQVASKDAEPWLDLVSADLEAVDYAFGAVAFPSASVGAPHVRDRTYWMAYAHDARLERWRKPERQREIERAVGAGSVVGGTGPVNGFWRDADWIGGRDGKWRPVEPGAFPLAHGVPARVGRVRAYGNAINPQQGAEFMRAVMECSP